MCIALTEHQMEDVTCGIVALTKLHINKHFFSPMQKALFNLVRSTLQNAIEIGYFRQQEMIKL